jgi:dienelactone hydrolase
MWSTSSNLPVAAPLRSLALSLSLALAGASCSHLPPAHDPRPALPLPQAIADRYRIPGDVIEDSLVPIGAEDDVAFFRGRLRAGDETAEFYYVRPRHEVPLPFVLCLPILAGGRELMWMTALGMAERGYAAAWTERVASALRAGQRSHDLELLFRRTVVHNRMVLAWARQQSELDPARTACIGISMGGMIGTAVLAVEPQLRGAALCLAGGDLAGMVRVSSEERVHSWLEWRRRTDGSSGTALERELRHELVSDPARLGPYIATEKVLLIGGSFDTVVPLRHQDLLWESLGRPERRLLPLGHYSAALAFGSIVSHIDTFLHLRFAGAASGSDPSEARPVATPR